MPLGGDERVGRAYVEIYADGSSIPDDIRDELRNADPVVRGEAEDHGETYDRHFAEGMEKQGDIGKSIRTALEKGVADADLTDAFFNGRGWAEFRDQVSQEFGDTGAFAADQMADEFSRRGSLEGIETEIRRFNQRVQRTIVEAAKADQAIAREMADDLNRQMDAMNREQEADFDRHVRDLQRNVTRITDQFDQITDAIQRMERGEESNRGSRADLIRDLISLGGLMKSAGGAGDEWQIALGDAEKRLIVLHPRLSAFNRRIDDAGNALGRAFGKGSRNDFANAIGSIAGGMVSLLGIIPRGIGQLQDFGRSVKFAFDDSFRNSGSVFRASMASITAALETGGALIGGIAVFATGAVLVIGPLIGLLSTLAGIITALVSSIAFGLVGAITAAAGLLLPLAAGIGVVVAAFVAMSDAQKKALSIDVKPVLAAFKDVGEAASKTLFANAEEQARRFSKVVEGMVPLFGRLGTAISHVADFWLGMLESPSWTRFQSAMNTFLPGAVESLGNSLASAFGGFLGIIRGALPLIDQFLGWLENVTGEFDNWANSRSGQRELRQFFADAADSGQHLWDVVKGVGRVFKELFSAGRESGDTMLDDLTGGLNDIADWLDTHGPDLQQWFDDAEETFRSLGGLVEDVAEAFDSLDDALSRSEARGAIRAIGFALEGIALAATIATGGILLVVDAVDKLIHSDVGRGIGSGLGFFFGAVAQAARDTGHLLVQIVRGDWMEAIFDAVGDFDWGGIWDGIVGAARAVVRAIERIFSNIHLPHGNLGGGLQFINPGAVLSQINKAVGFFAKMPGRVRNAVKETPGLVRSALSAIPGIASGIMGRLPGFAQNAVSRIGGIFRGLPGQVRSGISSIPGFVSGLMARLPGFASNAISRIASFFRGLPGQVSGAIAAIPGIVSGVFSRAASAVAGIPGRIAGYFSGLAGRILSAIGSIDIGSLIHVPDPGGGVPFVPGIATGGLVTKRTLAWVGEDGNEAVVPLDRPLSQVDPAVRMLSAIAQGLAVPFGSDSSRKVDASGWTIVSPSADPAAVARETLNVLVSQTY